MSRRLLAFLLSELKTVLVICKSPHCGAITEVPLDKLSVTFHKNECPACKCSFAPDGAAAKMRGPDSERNWLDTLARTIAGLQGASERVDVEFVLPDNGTDDGK